MKEREAVLEIIEDLRAKYGQGGSRLKEANEAKTRLLLIDRVLRALGWSEEEFNPETAVSSTSYTDYLLTIDNAPRLIVEAKRTGYTFGEYKKRRGQEHYTLRYLRSAFGTHLAELIDQARRYALQTHVPFSVLTNGGEWMLVQLLITPGFSNLDEVSGVYFGSIFSDDFNFNLLWELISRQNVKDGVIEAYFSQINAKEAEYSRTVQEQYGPLRWQASRSADFLPEFYNHFFDEIVDPGRRRMLERCFVSDARLDQYQGDLQRTLRDTAPNFLSEAVELTPRDRNRLIANSSGDQKGKVVLVTGSVGCGKTTLVHKVLVEARQGANLVVLVIDLINEVRSSDVAAQLWSFIEEEWKSSEPDSLSYDELKKIFGQELSELKRGPNAMLFEHDESEYRRAEADLLQRLSSDPEKYFSKCWRYYRQKSKGIAVFLDNVDRLSHEYQEEVYAFAHKLAHRTGVTVIVTMREFTFFRGQTAGFLDVRQDDNIFHLKAPNATQVLSKRIQYIENDIDNDHRLATWRANSDWLAFRAAVMTHAGTLKANFLEEEGQERLGLLESLAWHSIRRLLGLLRNLHNKLGDEPTPWTVAELISALLTPSAATESLVTLSNVYRPALSNFQCYFLKLRILSLMIDGQREFETRRGTYFSRIRSFMGMYGYHEHWTRLAVQELVREGFLECLEGPAEPEYTTDYRISFDHSFRPSPLAIVMLDRVAVEPAYLSLIGNDLPFHDSDIIEKYERELLALYSVLEKNTLERSAVSLVEEATLGRVVAGYLRKMYERERAPDNLLNYVPELGAIEVRLSRLAKKLADFSGTELQESEWVVEPTQFPLMLVESSSAESVQHSIPPIPDGILKLTIDRSEQAPLILWAMVALRMRGQQMVTGTQITTTINEHLTDDSSRKSATNISRALRGKTLQAQPWLETKHLTARKKLFRLADGWTDAWEESFQIPAPSL